MHLSSLSAIPAPPRTLGIPFPSVGLTPRFLNDPRRAGDLYSDPQDIAEDLILLWIQHVKKCLVEGYPWLWISWLDLLENCRSSPRILHVLESLDLAQVCDPRHINPANHWSLHYGNPGLRNLRYILEWLQKFPDPPLQAIAFWEKQIAVIQQCEAIHPDPREVRDPSSDESPESSPGVESE
ncbi:hypothetical protein FB451DRAFT_1186876 [Mycena latifolia]|nr:hypothetical protein FB451DRAFT_1186876 [Mycena latifolia]